MLFKINWKHLWGCYDRWFIRNHEDVSWHMMQKQIEKLVNKQIKDKIILEKKGGNSTDDNN